MEETDKMTLGFEALWNGLWIVPLDNVLKGQSIVNELLTEVLSSISESKFSGKKEVDKMLLGLKFSKMFFCNDLIIVTQPLTRPLDVWPSQVGDQILAESIVCLDCEFLDPDNWIHRLCQKPKWLNRLIIW